MMNDKTPITWERTVLKAPDSIRYCHDVFSIYENPETGRCFAYSGHPHYFGPIDTESVVDAKARVEAFIRATPEPPEQNVTET